MPVIVIGADTPLGATAVDALLGRAGEVRAFVTDPYRGLELRGRGVKVATGDVTDGSHVGGAALRCFCAVMVPTAAVDGRERSFAATPEGVVAAWASGLRDAGVTRALWLDDGSDLDPFPVAAAVAEMAVIPTAGRSALEISADIARLDAATSL